MDSAGWPAAGRVLNGGVTGNSLSSVEDGEGWYDGTDDRGERDAEEDDEDDEDEASEPDRRGKGNVELADD